MAIARVTTFKIYLEAGFAYPYKQTSNFAAYVEQSGRFREVAAEPDRLQAGDILLWPGHMAVYAPFPVNHPKRHTGVYRSGTEVENNLYTAFNGVSGKPYGPYEIKTFRRDAYRAYRYLLLKGEPKC